MPSFSQRQGLKPAIKSIQKDSIDDELRNRLWSLLKLFVWDFWSSDYQFDQRAREVENLLDKLWFSYFKKPIDERPEMFGDPNVYGSRRCYDVLKSHFLKCRRGDAFAKFHFEFATKKPPPELFHYTTNASFIAILGSRCMLATERMFLNDPREFQWGYEQMHAAMQCEDCPKYETDFIDQIRFALEDKPKDDLHLFIVSLSENPDVLNQWTLYADDGRGVCFGLRGETLRERAGFGEFLAFTDTDEMPTGFWYHYHLLPVIYEQTEQRTLLLAFLKAAHKYWTFLKGENSTRTEELFRLMVQHRMKEILISLKDPGYRAEREWRIVATAHKTDESISFRSCNYGIVPFGRLNLSPRSELPNLILDITSVWIGPDSKCRDNLRGVEMLLDHYKVDAKIFFSNMRYRSSRT